MNDILRLAQTPRCQFGDLPDVLRDCESEFLEIKNKRTDVHDMIYLCTQRA